MIILSSCICMIILSSRICFCRMYFRTKMQDEELKLTEQPFLDSQKQAFLDLLKENDTWNEETRKLRFYAITFHHDNYC